MPTDTPVAAGLALNASAIPVLETRRLRLRPFRLADLDAASAMWADPEVVRFIGGTPRSRAEVWTAACRSFGHWALLGYGFWVLAERDTDAYLGEIGLLEGLREIEASYSGTPEAGWAIAQEYWGNGYVSEALAAVLRWSDAHLDCARTVCIIEPAHQASLRIAANNGYREIGTTLLGDSPILILARPSAS